jgi:rhodanese-related sulfurtransferase
MNVEQLLQLRDEVRLIDVRRPHEWEAGRSEGSFHLPLDELPGRLNEVDRRRPVVTVCRGGPRSLEAADALRADGIQAENLEGGILAWAERGLPLVAQGGQAGAVAPASEPKVTVPDQPYVQTGGPYVALATAPMRDLELAATVAGTAEELGYSTIWVADEPTGNGPEVAAAMQRATTSIRVGLRPIGFDPGRPDSLVPRLAASGLVAGRTALALDLAWQSLAAQSPRSTFFEYRKVLGNEWALGICALTEDACQLAGELGDFVFLDWMSSQRMAWARGHVEQGALLRAEGSGQPQVIGCVRVALGPGASLRLSAKASTYLAKPHDALSFEAMGSATAGIAAVDPSQASALAQPFRAALDEMVICPVAILPTTEAPALGEVFEALSTILQIGHAFAPGPGLSS